MRVRTALTAAATIAVSTAVLSPLQAHAAPDHWFGDLVIDSHSYPEDKMAGAMATPRVPKNKKGLPFHSWTSAELHHCDGTVTERIGWVSAERDDNKPWTVFSTVDLGFDAASGPYEKWVVKVHSKGRRTVTKTVTSTDVFTLGCAGEFTADAHLEAPTTELKKPLTANYKVSANKALASRARFGTVSGLRNGRVVAGSTIAIKGAGALVKGKRRTLNCSTRVDVTFPGRPSLAAGTGGHCNQKIVMPKKLVFHGKTKSTKKHSLVGKRVFIGTDLEFDGHSYTQYFDLGRAVKK